jgi:phosphatidylglycerol---prolipoprotein diacylglyceryl transferase
MFLYNTYPHITIGFFSIESFRLMAYIAAMTAIMVATLSAQNTNNPKNFLTHTLLQIPLIILFMIIGARFFYYFGPWTWEADWTIIDRFMEFIRIGGTGLVFYGGFFGVLMGIISYCKIRNSLENLKLNTWKYIDIWSPACVLGLAISRIGCFLGGCCYGLPTDVPWAIIRDGVPIHATQLYSSFSAFLMFGVLIILNKKKRFSGFIFLITAIWYSVHRLIIEFMRYNNWYFLNLSASQWISIIVFGVSTYLFLIKWKKYIHQKKS